MNDDTLKGQCRDEAYDCYPEMTEAHKNKREAYAACLEERAIPAERRVAELEAENARLREAAQGTITVEDAMQVMRHWDTMHATHGHQPWDTLRDMLTDKANDR
jgi:hypothetical protein